MAKKPLKIERTALRDSEDSDVPLGEKLAKEKKMIQNKAAKEAKAIRKAENNAVVNGSASKKRKSVKKEDSDDDEPIVKKARPASSSTPKDFKKLTKPSPKKGKVKQEETEQDEDAEAEEEEYKWWEDPTKGDGTKKWATLEHNGVVFPPPYEPLPKRVKMLYDGKPVSMKPDAEEIAGFFGSMLNSTLSKEFRQ